MRLEIKESLWQHIIDGISCRIPEPDVIVWAPVKDGFIESAREAIS
jgi:hypothetical protein